MHGTLTAKPDYALPVHEGWSRTNPILPRRKQALKFKINGRAVIVKRVISPASYEGRPFLWRGLVEGAVPRGFRVYRVTR